MVPTDGYINDEEVVDAEEGSSRDVGGGHQVKRWWQYKLRRL